MKILMFGAGVIGTLYGWAFENAGHSVSLLVRPGWEDRWTNGIMLQILDARGGREQEVAALYRPHIVTSLAAEDGYDVVVEAVRYSQTEEVLPELVAGMNELARGPQLVPPLKIKIRPTARQPRPINPLIHNRSLPATIFRSSTRKHT